MSPEAVTTPKWTPQKLALVALPLSLVVFLGVSLADLGTAQTLFVNATYYFLLLTVLCWAGTYLYSVPELRREKVFAWAKENWPGLVIAFTVTAVTAFAVEPALRMLSDEANLLGVSKNLYASKTATFTVSGKNYYGSFWDVDVAIDRRPTLFPFLVSLVHAVCGYSYRNVFVFNLLILPAFLLVSYRLAKALGGERFGVVAALFAAAHPITLLAVRSGGFDFFATFFALLALQSLRDFCHDRSPANLAILWMNLCLFAEIRYESALFIPPVLAFLLLFKMVERRMLRPYALVYVLTPAFLLPRIWQSALRGNVPEQEPGTVTFSVENFFDNVREYFAPLLSPSAAHPHSVALIALGVAGTVAGLGWLFGRVRAGDARTPEARFATFVAVWMLVQVVIVFSYSWGRAQFPSAARLFVAIDTYFSFAGAWVLTRSLVRFRPFVTVLLASAVLASQLPVASRQWTMNRLTQTRESAALWSFFERLNEKRILIVTDRPNHFTVMDYGAMNFDTARRDRYLFTAFARRLFQDVYVVQQIQLSTNAPRPGYELWPDRKLEPVLEFQNDANVLIRVSRLAR